MYKHVLVILKRHGGQYRLLYADRFHRWPHVHSAREKEMIHLGRWKPVS